MKLELVQKLCEGSWIWKKGDNIGIKGFKFSKNLAQTSTWRTFAWIFKCQNWTECFFKKEEPHNTSL